MLKLSPIIASWIAVFSLSPSNMFLCRRPRSQSASVASGYGGFGNTASIPGNFPMNPAGTPSGTNLSYDDVLSSQYKDTNHLMSLQQGENSAMWLHGPGSRTMSVVPANT